MDKIATLKFSLLMSLYYKDNAVYFDRALESVTCMQSIIPNEIVLVVDGPIGDDLNQIINKYTCKYNIFNVIRLEKNVGLGNALKIGLEHVKYEIVARMDSDDISCENRFAQQLELITANKEIDVVGGDISEFIDNEENIVANRKVPTTDVEIKKYMKTRCAFNHMAVMFRKSSVLLAGGYEDLFWNEDYFLWIRMQLNNCVFANTGTILVNVRTGSDMYSRRGGKKYFQSELYLQKYMLSHKMIGRLTYCNNVIKRWIVQRLLPNSLRGWVFRHLAR